MSLTLLKITLKNKFTSLTKLYFKLKRGLCPQKGYTMKREIHCHKCNQRNDQYWIDGKYRWLSSKSLNALNGWTIEPDDYTYTPNKQGWSIVCEDCQQERHDKRFFGKLKKLTINLV